jgi:hypothetical protein
MNQKTIRIGLAGIILSSLVAAAPLQAATFRAVSKIFQGANLDAEANHLLLFDEGLVYDLPQIRSRFVTVFDEAQQQVILLDRQTRVQTTVGTEDLLKFSAKVRAQATAAQKEKFGLEAIVKPSTRVIGYSIKFGNLEYNATTQKPEDVTKAADYGRFFDLASRLNIYRQLGAPPFGRMTLNQHIMGAGEIPLEVMLTRRQGDKSEEFRSTLEIDEMQPHDREKIDEVIGMLKLYKTVQPKEFPSE